MNRSRQNIQYVVGVLVGTLTIYGLETYFSSKHGIWWGLLGGGVVFEFLYILGSSFLNKKSQARFFSGIRGMATISGKLSWEIFYIAVGLKYLATPWGLVLGGLISLGWFYYCLRDLKENL
ncbi:MAG: hypothetical protein WCI18_00760 [Pseudomonadota bacterium]